MTTLRCLHLEHEEKDLKRFGHYLSMAWDKLQTGVKLEIIPVGTPDEALDIIRTRSSEFHLLVADILFPTEGDPEGLHVLAAARDVPTLAVMALSSGDVMIAQRVQDLGVKFVSKLVTLTKDETLSGLAAAMLEVLRAKGYDPYAHQPSVIDYDLDNLPLAALVERIGTEVISTVVRKLLGNSYNEITLAYVRAGLSGAAVMRADCSLNQPGQARKRRKLLLKFSRDRGLLNEEYERREEAASFPTGLFATFLAKEPVEAGGWYAIGADYLPLSSTLADWLREALPDTRDVDRMLSSLFLDGGLSEVYADTVDHPDLRPNVALWNVLVLPRRAHIHLAVQQLSKLVTRHDSDRHFDPALIDGFLLSKRFADVDEETVPPGVIYCRNHGDLHARNVLVDNRATPHLIDPAAIRQQHWALDVARLIVDLAVSSYGGGLEAYEWDALPDWFHTCSATLRLTALPTPAEETDRPVIHALGWLLNNLPQIHHATWSEERLWEFQLAMAIEFLRASGRAQDLPAPKRVLALLSACDALRASAEAFQRRSR